MGDFTHNDDDNSICLGNISYALSSLYSFIFRSIRLITFATNILFLETQEYNIYMINECEK